VISNPFGLPHKCYLAGAEVEMALPVSVLLHGQSLNITAVTYDQNLQIAFLGLETELPDIQHLADYTVLAFDELKVASAPAPYTTNDIQNQIPHQSPKP
jgi:diacylglycerol O-acyltransferase